jgi:hypothetical protein
MMNWFEQTEMELLIKQLESDYQKSLQEAILELEKMTNEECKVSVSFVIDYLDAHIKLLLNMKNELRKYSQTQRINDLDFLRSINRKYGVM